MNSLFSKWRITNLLETLSSSGRRFNLSSTHKMTVASLFDYDIKKSNFSQYLPNIRLQPLTLISRDAQIHCWNLFIPELFFLVSCSHHPAKSPGLFSAPPRWIHCCLFFIKIIYSWLLCHSSGESTIGFYFHLPNFPSAPPLWESCRKIWVFHLCQSPLTYTSVPLAGCLKCCLPKNITFMFYFGLFRSTEPVNVSSFTIEADVPM